MSYFTENICGAWDGRIYMRSIPGKTDWMELTVPLPCGSRHIPAGYEWNGASVGVLRYSGPFAFPKWKHPIATCRHDIRCQTAKTKKERKWADQQFKKDVSRGGTWWEKQKGYIGVRIGAFFT